MSEHVALYNVFARCCSLARILSIDCRKVAKLWYVSRLADEGVFPVDYCGEGVAHYLSSIAIEQPSRYDTGSEGTDG